MQGASAAATQAGNGQDRAGKTAGRSASLSGLTNLADTEKPIGSRPLPGTMLCMALIAAALILGGGGTTNPQNEMILQVLTALLMIPLVASATYQRGLAPVPGAAWLIAGLVLLLPIAQLIPLPPSIWHALPGRAIEIQSLALDGADQAWMPLTMAPARTFASLLAMIFPVLVMLQVSRLSLRGRNWLCGVIVVVGVLSLLLGVLQLSHTGGWDWSLYTQFSEGSLIGFQANRNAEADILLIVMMALCVLAVVRMGDGRHHGLTWVGLQMSIGAIIVGQFLTGSRTGIALCALTLIILGVMLWPMVRRWKLALWWLGGASGAIAIVGILLIQLPSVQKVLTRFSLTKEARWDLWADTMYAAHQVWPFGSGIGTIVPMLESAERLEVVDTTLPVRAHNDWLEWVLEGGLPGLVILGAVLLVVGYLAFRAISSATRLHTAPGRRAQVIFACGLLVIEALHSIVDYPMRSMALATLIALAVAFLIEPAAPQRRQL